MFDLKQKSSIYDNIPHPDINMDEPCPVCEPVANDPFPLISPKELVKLFTCPTSNNYNLIITIDARFPYEFRGGHIMGAKNISSREMFVKLYNSYKNLGDVCIVFHCEFSHNRGPALMKMFREYDRMQNIQNYPKLSYPNIFLLKGGYNKFYNEYSNFCIGGYTPMRDQKYIDNGELRRCHSILKKSTEINNEQKSARTRLMRTISQGVEQFIEDNQGQGNILGQLIAPELCLSQGSL